MTDRTSRRTRFVYDDAHFLNEVIDPLGNVPLRNEYDAEGRLVAQIDAEGNRTELDIDLVNNTTTVTDRLGDPTVLFYNQRGLVERAARRPS